MRNKLKITVLVDNEASHGLVQEHGLSLWLEAGTEHILLDTGQGHALPENARRLGIDLERADILALSHGHYDHTGGIGHVLSRAVGVQVCCHPAALHRRYSIPSDVAKAVSMPAESVAAVEQLPSDRLHWTSSPVLISKDIGLTGPIPRETGYENTGGDFYLDPEKRRADLIEDDQALWINTAEGLVICAGCCHAGLVNTLRYVCHLTGSSRTRAIIGGFHLHHASDDRLEQTVAALQSLAPEMIVPCHCTGARAVDALRAALGKRVISGQAGTIYEFDQRIQRLALNMERCS